MEKTSHSSCISPAATSMSAGEGSWAMHIANFLESTHHGQDITNQEVFSDSSFSSGFSSSFASFGNDASFITSEPMCDDDEDDSLQDTACSSAAGPKVASMNNVNMKSMVTMDAKEMNIPQLARYFVDVGSRQQIMTNAVQEVISGDNNNEKALYECNELRKKGLCLVPLSMLINYLG